MLSIFSVPSLANVNVANFDAQANKTDNLQLASKDDSPYLHGYTYVDDLEKNTRTFDSPDLAPKIYETFCAPSGHVYNLSISDELATELADQIEFYDVDLNSFSIKFYYGIYGTEVALLPNVFGFDIEEGMTIEEQKEELKKLIIIAIDGNELLKLEEVTTQADLYVRVDFILTKTNPETWESVNKTIAVVGEKMVIEQYSEFDYVDYGLSYSQKIDKSKKIEVSYDLIPGFFKQYDDDVRYSYNPYGWTTKDTEEINLDGDYRCIYKVTLVAFDTVTIGTFKIDEPIEMTYPDSPIRAKIKLEFSSNKFSSDKENYESYSYYSPEFIIGDPNARLIVDNIQERKVVQKNTEHLYMVQFDNIEVEKLVHLEVNVYGVIDRLMPDNSNVIYLYDKTLPETGVDGVYYYEPSDNEITLHNQGRDSEFLNNPSEGTYKIWNGSSFVAISKIGIINAKNQGDESEPISSEELYGLLNHTISFPFTGRFSQFYIDIFGKFSDSKNVNIENIQYAKFEIIPHQQNTSEIVLDVSDSVNLLDGGDDIAITPQISSDDENISYYYSYSLSKEGVIQVSQDENGKTSIHPLKSGLVDLTFIADSSELGKITKTISVRIIDGVYDNSKIVIKDEFHKARVDLTATLSVRGFSNILNANVIWKVTDKKGNEVSQDRVVANKNASMTLLNPGSDDYTIKALYEDIEISNTKVEVRFVDMDSFLRFNIWWIVVITLGFALLVFFIIRIARHSKSTVDRIERVYQVYCQCISNDSLSKEELVRIKKEITKCLRHCQNLNIDAFNQYEKATRYLRKSLNDTKALIKNYDSLSNEEKSVMYERLDADLGKALRVAQEIENAKQLIEEHFVQANAQNYEVLPNDKKEK